MDAGSGLFTNYRNNPKDSNSLSSNSVFCITGDHNNEIWIGTGFGLDKLDNQNRKFHHYLAKTSINSIYVDANNIVWAGAENGLYFLDRKKNVFILFRNQFSSTINGILHILEDDKKYLWVSTKKAW